MPTTEEQIQLLEQKKQAGADIFYTQQQMIDSLSEVIDVIRGQSTVVSAAPAELPRQTPNYTMYVLIGLAVLGAIFFLKKKKR